MPVFSQVNTTQETFGPTQFASYGKSSRDGFFWRMFQRSLFTHTREPFSATWPRAGIVCDGIAYTLPPLVPIIDEIDCGLWPTPAARDWRGTSSATWRQSNTSCDTLPDVVADAVGIPCDVAVVCQPMFVESVMQWPTTWTDSKSLAMDKFQQWLRQHGSC